MFKQLQVTSIIERTNVMDEIINNFCNNKYCITSTVSSVPTEIFNEHKHSEFVFIIHQ
jgi:hypothetical protein